MSQNSQTSFQSLHEDIQYGDLEEVKNFVSGIQSDKKAYNDRNESAISTAIRFGRCEIYELLLSSNFSLGPHEDIERILAKSGAMRNNVKLRRQFREIHKKYFKVTTPKHLIILQEKSKLSHEASEEDRKMFQPEIVKAFEDLNDIFWIRPLLKLAAMISTLSIVFDFGHDTVEHMDPTKNDAIRGTTYSIQGYIFIGAKKLLNISERCEALGTLVHELCHFVMQIVYGNDCKPYKIDDVENHQKFIEILNDCAGNCELEEIIFYAFDCNESIQHAELIVRVPHLLAIYKESLEKIQGVREIFLKLFKFFEEKVLVDIEKKIEELEAKTEIDEVNDTIGTLKEIEKWKTCLHSCDLNVDASKNIVRVITNCCKLTMKAIHRFKVSENIFTTFESLKDHKIFEMIFKALKLCITPTLVVNCEDVNETDVIEVALKFNNLDVKQRIIFVSKSTFIIGQFSADIIERKIDHTWSQLTAEAQEVLLEFQVKFQGNQTSLKDILVKDSEAFNVVPLDDLINRRQIEIDHELKFDDIKFHIARKFLPSHIEQEEESENSLYDEEMFLEVAEQTKTILLCDKPGNGKTTSFKTMATKLKGKFPLHFVAFIDLKSHVEVYEKDEKFVGKTIEKLPSENQKTFLNFLCEKILKLNDFGTKVFVDLFNLNRVIMLMDGFDEISPNYKKFVIKIIQFIEASNNQLWISTRTHLESELSSKVNAVAFRLIEFSVDDQKKFFEEFMKSKGESGLSLETKLKEIENFMLSLSKKTNFSTSNPLLMRMIAEIYNEGLNLTADTNLFSIYDEFVKKTIQNCMRKGEIAERDLAECCTNLREFHHQTAIRLLFYNNQEINRLIDDIEASPSIEQMTRVGLTFGENFETLHFVHQTFAEFFTADFIRKTIFARRFFDEELAVVSNFLALIFTSSDTKLTRSFFNESFATFNFSLDPMKFKSFRKILENFFNDEEKLKVLYLFVQEGLMNLIKIVAFILRPNQELLKKLWHQKNSSGHSVSIFTFGYQSIEFAKNFCMIAEENLDSEGLKQIIHDTNEKLFMVRESSDKLFEFFVYKTKTWLSDDELKFLCCNKSGAIKSFINNAAFYQKFKAYKNLSGFIKRYWGESFLNLMTTSPDGESEWNMLLHVCNYGTTEDITELLQCLSEKLSSEELLKIVLQPNSFGVTSVMFVAGNKDEKAFRVFWNFFDEIFDTEAKKKILFGTDHRQLKVFHWGLRNSNEKNFEAVKNLYLDINGLDAVKELVLSENNDHENAFYVAIKFDDVENEKSIDALWTFMQEIFDREILKNALSRRSKMGKTLFMKTWKLRKLQLFVQAIKNIFTENELRRLGFISFQ